MEGTTNGPKIAYLVNRYPAVSHTFIRREITALEALGTPVQRYSVRSGDQTPVDPDDQLEQQRTRVILSTGPLKLAGSLLREAFTGPGRFAAAVGLMWRTYRRSRRSLAVHLAYLAEACVLRRWLADAGIKHLHVHYMTNPATVAMLCRALGGPAYSVTVHGPEEIDHAVNLALDEKIKRAAFVVAITDYCRSQLMRWCDHGQWDKIKIVGCGLDDAFLDAPRQSLPDRTSPNGAHRGDANADPPQLVCVGRLCEQKAPLLLVEAAGRLAAEGRDFRLVLVGDGELRPLVEQRINELGLADIVTIMGWASNDAVREHIRASRALVLPSFAEGLPVVIMEALALNRPVISTYIAGIPELVEDGRCGWLVPAGALEPLVDAMRQAMDAPAEQLQRMGQIGAERVRERHSAIGNAAKLRAHIREAHGDRAAQDPAPVATTTAHA